MPSDILINHFLLFSCFDTHRGTMLPSPCGMGSGTLPGSLLQMRLGKTFSPVVVLRRAALPVVRSHLSADAPIPSKRVSLPSRTSTNRRYDFINIETSFVRLSSFNRNVINSNRNTYRQIPFRSCTAQDLLHPARISKIFSSPTCNRPSSFNNVTL